MSQISDAWPSLFTHGRTFDQETESRPYLNHLDELYATLYESGSEGEGEESSDDGSDDDSESDAEHDSDSFPDNLVIESLSPVRRFNMATVWEEAEYSIQPGQHDHDAVADFVESSLANRFEAKGIDAISLVAIVDVERKTSTAVGSMPERRRSKPGRAGLTRPEFRRELNKPRFPPLGDGMNGDENRVVEDRKFIYIPNLDAPEMETLVNTATLTQRDAVLNLFHHHIHLSPLIEVQIPCTGFRAFNLYMHLPYFVLREHMDLHRDPRVRRNGTPLRGSWTVRCINATPTCLYDAQASVAVFGIEERIWTAIGTMDTFFEPPGSRHSVKHHHDRRKTSRDRQDPISGRMYPQGGAQNSELSSFSDPRKYFLALLEQWMRIIVVPEYRVIVRKMQEAATETDDSKPHGRQMRELSKRNDDFLEHLPMIIDRISETLDAWDTFKDEDIEYFTEKSKNRYLKNARGSFRKLNQYREKLQNLESAAKAKNKAINTKIGLESHDATVEVRVLAVLAMAFMPLSHVIQLFSAEKLPFTFNAISFSSLSLVVVLAHAAVYWLILNWRGRVKLVATACGDRFRPWFDLFPAVSRIQEAFNATVQTLVRRQKPPSELPGFQPGQLAASTVQVPPATGQPPRVGTRSPWAKTLRRNPTEDCELNAMV